IQNVVCDGADRAILIRGLPEMSIKDIFLDGITIKSNRGADIMEAKNISLKNVVLQCAAESPLINVENSSNLFFSQLKAVTAPDVFFSINGERSKENKVEKTDLSGAK